MTNYEKICAYINAWHYAIAEYDDNKIKFTDITEQGRLCYNHGRCDEGRLSNLSITRIYPLPRPIPQYKVGDKVVVLENIKELLCNTSIVVGGIYRVSDVNSNGTIHLDNCIVSFLPHCVAPYLEDDIEEMTVEQICKALGKNIKIVK